MYFEDFLLLLECLEQFTHITLHLMNRSKCGEYMVFRELLLKILRQLLYYKLVHFTEPFL
jgi:hypothetical protein